MLEFESTAVLHKFAELARVATTKFFQTGLNLLLLDVVVLFVLRASRQALPRQLTLDEVEQHVANCFQIVTTRLLDTLVCSDRGVPSGTSKVFAILPGDVLTLRVFVALGEAEIDDVNVITGSVRAANQEVIRLDIAVDDALLVNLFDSADELDSDHEDSLEIKVALARLEEILE